MKIIVMNLAVAVMVSAFLPLAASHAEESGMMGMMHECMEMRKGDKNGAMTCDHETMEKCQAKMEKSECMSMMNDIKKKEEAKPKPTKLKASKPKSSATKAVSEEEHKAHHPDATATPPSGK